MSRRELIHLNSLQPHTTRLENTIVPLWHWNILIAGQFSWGFYTIESVFLLPYIICIHILCIIDILSLVLVRETE